MLKPSHGMERNEKCREPCWKILKATWEQQEEEVGYIFKNLKQSVVKRYDYLVWLGTG
jgi:hypothetical protein